VRPFSFVLRFTRTRRLLGLVLVIGGCGATVAGAAAVALATGILATSSKPLVHATCTLTASAADTYVDEFIPAGANGASTTISTSPRSARRRRIYIRFDLASCATAIPSGAEVDSATLKLTTTVVPPSARTLSVWRATSAWAAGTATWTLQPTVAPIATTTLAIAVASGVKSFDVTNDVNDFVQSAPLPTPPPYASAVSNLGWMIDDEGAAATATITFASNENATVGNRPSLVIAYGS
jgi:hypothetical protein